MKKIFAILLLVVLAFNLAGYRFLFAYLECKSESQMFANIDLQAYDPSDVFEVKIPLNMPYLQNYTCFERYDGTAEVNGVYYNYVDRKIINDTLIMHCIFNSHRTDLHNAQNDYSKINTQNNPAAKSNQVSLLLSILITGSPVHYICYQLSSFDTSLKYFFPKNNDAVYSAFIVSPYQPPESV